jgi:hypothetical protein
MTGEFKRDNIVISTKAHRFFIGSGMEKSLNFVYKLFQRSLHSAVLRSR